MASSWWADHIRKSDGASAETLSIADQFERALADVLTAHYASHWYPDDVLRGSGYRAIVYDHRIDTVLVAAAERIGVDRAHLERLLGRRALEDLVSQSRFSQGAERFAVDGARERHMGGGAHMILACADANAVITAISVFTSSISTALYKETRHPPTER